MSVRLILFTLAVAFLMTGLCIIVLIAEGLRARRQRALQEDLQLASERLRAAMADPVLIAATAKQLRALPLPPVAIRLADLAESVSGREQVRTIRTVAELAMVRLRLTRWCEDRRWWRRMFAVRMLARLGLDEGHHLRLLRDDNGAVRGAAASAGAINPTRPVVQRLLVMLDDPEPFVRFTAEGALLIAGPSVTEDLLYYLSDPTSPRLAAALEVARTHADPRFLRPALALRSNGLRKTPEHVRQLHPPTLRQQDLAENPAPLAETLDEHRTQGEKDGGTGDAAVRVAAARLLAAIAGAAAASALGELLDDPDATVRTAAAEGLGRLGSWSHGTDLVHAMNDSDWNVRQAATFALRGMGAIGRLYLRDVRRNGNVDASTIAGLALDELPGSAARAT